MIISFHAILLNLALFIGWALVLLGLFFIMSGAIGMLRFDGFFNKIHAAGVSDSCGIFILLIGFSILQFNFIFSLKFLLLGFFLLASGAFSTHALAKAGLMNNLDQALLNKEKQDE